MLEKLGTDFSTFNVMKNMFCLHFPYFLFFASEIDMNSSVNHVERQERTLHLG